MKYVVVAMVVHSTMVHGIHSPHMHAHTQPCNYRVIHNIHMLIDNMLFSEIMLSYCSNRIGIVSNVQQDRESAI